MLNKASHKFMNSQIMISVVVPVYRSSNTLGELVNRLSAVLSKHVSLYEIILVDDASPDSSWEVLCSLSAQFPEHVSALRLMRNYGQHNALMCGFRHAKGDVVITLDDDLQNPPEEIPKLLQRFSEGDCDIVYGEYEQKQHSLWRNVGSRVVQRLVRKSIGLARQVSSFRLISRSVLRASLRYDLNYTFVDGLLAWNTQRIAWVKVRHDARKNGNSGYSLLRLLQHAMNIVTNFSLMPLQAASCIGMLAAFLGFGTGVYYLVQALLNNIAAPGFASIIVAVLILGGLQLLALGIIGEYVGRMHLNVNRKPQYTIREVRRAESAAESSAVEGDDWATRDDDYTAAGISRHAR